MATAEELREDAEESEDSMGAWAEVTIGDIFRLEDETAPEDRTEAAAAAGLLLITLLGWFKWVNDPSGPRGCNPVPGPIPPTAPEEAAAANATESANLSLRHSTTIFKPVKAVWLRLQLRVSARICCLCKTVLGLMATNVAWRSCDNSVNCSYVGKDGSSIRVKSELLERAEEVSTTASPPRFSIWVSASIAWMVFTSSPPLLPKDEDAPSEKRGSPVDNFCTTSCKRYHH